MSAPDPTAARGQQPYDPTRCACTHLSTLHALNDAGARRACTASTCNCRAFTEEKP